jgi:hypothetical protein
LARGLFISLIALLALVLGPLAAWTISELRTREAMARGEVARLAGQMRDAETARTAREARILALEGERDAARFSRR